MNILKTPNGSLPLEKPFSCGFNKGQIKEDKMQNKTLDLRISHAINLRIQFHLVK